MRLAATKSSIKAGLGGAVFALAIFASRSILDRQTGIYQAAVDIVTQRAM
jgi:hypothetical protein